MFGFCNAVLPDGSLNPNNLEAYRVTRIRYHTHLLGREMYATLLHEGASKTADGTTASILKSVPILSAVKDIESQEFWIHDYQQTFPINRKITQDDSVLQETAMIPGDKIRVTFVYDSTGRVKDTSFGPSTYNEMFTTSAYCVPVKNSALSCSGSVTPEKRRKHKHTHSHTFYPRPKHVAALDFGEDSDDVQDILKDHSLGDAEDCTFPLQLVWALSPSAFRCPLKASCGMIVVR